MTYPHHKPSCLSIRLPDGRFLTVPIKEPPKQPSDPPKPATKRKRRPSVRSLVKQAERTGKQVTSVTVDGTTLHFGSEPEPTETNPWLAEETQP
jgi:hypothetical protein